jgi:hypothetical protein
MLETQKCIVLFAAFVFAATVAHAQGPGEPAPPHFGGPMELLGFEGMHGGKLVKGAPFSAQSNAETTQTLQDGTTIHRTSQGAVYRDNEGRSRHEMTLSGFGSLAASGTSHNMVAIADPVAGVHYMLDTQKKIAHKMILPDRSANGANAEGQPFHEKMLARKQQDEAAGTLKTEPLGTQLINGVNAEGTRTTHTIAVGQIGNDKPIQVVSERWYSPDIQMVVKSTRIDPRFGTSTYSLTNIQKTEPAAALFTVPADYSVQEGKLDRFGNQKFAPTPAP